jgi:hypothetical protein
MSEGEGVVKYRLDHRPGPLPPGTSPDALLRWFGRCRELGLIGRDPARYDGLAYGNISQRAADGFVVSGTQTGGLGRLLPSDLSWVTACDIEGNRLRSQGPARPSSEALTHAVVYRTLPNANAVIHAHAPAIWRHAAQLGLPCTPPDAAYGTPAMAEAVAGLLTARPSLPGLVAMGGHEDGILAYGADLDSAGALLLEVLDGVLAHERRYRPTEAPR